MRRTAPPMQPRSAPIVLAGVVVDAEDGHAIFRAEAAIHEVDASDRDATGLVRQTNSAELAPSDLLPTGPDVATREC
jgi:hypothetical protein